MDEELYYDDQYYGGAQQYGDQEVSQMSEMSPSTETVAEERRESRTWMMVIILCAAIIVILFLLTILLFTTLIFSTDSKEDAADTEDYLYEIIDPGRTIQVSTLTTTTAGSVPSTKAPTVTVRTTPGTTTTTEDTATFVADYSNPLYPDTHQYICVFNASSQGMRMFHRTYGIGLFPYIYCHIAVYCCYTMDPSFGLVPERPHVDLPPLDAVRRMANFKSDNMFLSVFLGLRGDHQDFTRLVKNDSGEQDLLLHNIEQWTKSNDYDGVRFLWQFPEANQSQPMLQMAQYMSDYLTPLSRSIGFFVPYEKHLREGFDTYQLAVSIGAKATIIGYPAEAIAVPATVKWYANSKNEIKNQFAVMMKKVPFNVTTSVCYPFPAAHCFSFTLESPCQNASSRLLVKDWGSPGPYSKNPGLLTVSEVCAEVDSTWSVLKRNFYTVACKDLRAVAYLDDDNAQKVMTALHDSYALGCLGVLYQEFDDYANKCNFHRKGLYPLQRGAWIYFRDAVVHAG